MIGASGKLPARNVPRARAFYAEKLDDLISIVQLTP